MSELASRISKIVDLEKMARDPLKAISNSYDPNNAHKSSNVVENLWAGIQRSDDPKQENQ